jgi:hypothetical protein
MTATDTDYQLSPRAATVGFLGGSAAYGVSTA